MKTEETGFVKTWSDAGVALFYPGGVALALLLLLSAGSAIAGVRDGVGVNGNDTLSGTVRPWDNAETRFTCRLSSGEVAASTEKIKKGETVSKIFVKREADDPVQIKALPSEFPPRLRAGISLEEAIESRISPLIVGMKAGETRNMTLESEEASEGNTQEYVLRMARVRVRPKTLIMSIDEFKGRARRSPEIGAPFIMDPSFPGKVETVAEDKVTIRFAAKSLKPISTDFGPGTVSEEAGAYKINIQAKMGELVRTASMVGRVTEVNDEVFIIDYRNPFGGEALNCDVTVEKVVREKLASLPESGNK